MKFSNAREPVETSRAPAFGNRRIAFAATAIWASAVIGGAVIGGAAAVGLAVFGAASAANAAESSSASFRLRTSTFASVSSTVDSAAVIPDFGSSGISLGQPEAIGLTGSSTTLETSASGFWPRVLGALVSLDLDGDGAQNFLDDDDDGDGLLDSVETDTGFFTSNLDTGSDALLFDTDGDGADDGLEVSAGTDPTDDQSSPNMAVGFAPLVALWVLTLALPWVAWRRVRRRS